VKRLLVLGATGVMGKRVVALAERLLPGVAIIRASRRSAPGTEDRGVDIHDPVSLRHGLAGIATAINAVGPYDYDPAPLLEACQEAGCHYVDLAETPTFIARAEQVASAFPLDRAVAVVSGCSTVPGLVQVLAQFWADRPEVERFRILLGMGSQNPVSPALLYSLLQPLGAKAPDGTPYFKRLVRKRLRGLPARLYGRYPSSFDATGLRVGGRVVHAEFYAGMDQAACGYALWLAARVVPLLSSGQLHVLSRLAQPFLPLVQRLGTRVGVLSVEAQDAGGRLIEEFEVRALQEGLNVPALPSVWAARRLLDDGSEPLHGPLGLDRLFTPEQAAVWLRQEGYKVHRQANGLRTVRC
jgi:Saccharopine dehydrogenase NADP binding domain